MQLKFRLNGARELELLLRELPSRVAANVTMRALRAGAAPIRDEARRLVPVDTGETRRSITIRSRRVRKKTRRAVGIGIFNPNRAHIATWLEFGTSRMPARPFLRPAFTVNAGKTFSIVANALGQGIEREALKLKKG